MDLPKLYLKAFRKQTHDAYPIWPIATDVKCGAIGTFERKQFSATGYLPSTIPPDLLETESNPVPGLETFSSFVNINLAGEAGGNPIPGAELSGEISFERAGGVFLEATGIVETRFKHLDNLRHAVQTTSGLDADRVFISSVFTFASATLLVADSSGWTLAVSGKTPVAPVKLASASVNLSVKSGTGLKREIPGDVSEHPYGIKVQGRRGWFSDHIKLLDASGGDDMGAFVDVTTAFDNEDD